MNSKQLFIIIIFILLCIYFIYFYFTRVYKRHTITIMYSFYNKKDVKKIAKVIEKIGIEDYEIKKNNRQNFAPVYWIGVKCEKQQYYELLKKLNNISKNLEIINEEKGW